MSDYTPYIESAAERVIERFGGLDPYGVEQTMRESVRGDIAHYVKQIVAEAQRRCCDAIRADCKACDGTGCDAEGMHPSPCMYCGYPIDAIKAYVKEAEGESE